MIGVEGLSVTLGGWRVLDGVTFHVARGEAVALVGANGAGKTTVLRCLLGLVGYAGEIRLGGIDPLRDPVGARSCIGYMPQVPVFCDERAEDSLAVVAALRGLPVDEVPALLGRVGLEAHARREVRVLSTGMRQRLSLAAALLGRPPVLVLDEPTASLDIRGQCEIRALLDEQRSRGRTLLLASHRAEEVRALVDRVVVLDQGRVVAAGPVDEIAPQLWGDETPRRARPSLRVKLCG